ncbi:chitobiase/beta-hexosaminidase C-terminal domain-containing protein [Haloferula chungangensis]|uniref:Chitobiase/beta-hexosaminidase C-terminal domain-containing protein n=1 Tax=Haloferula chungangensis TaxID=1048331 RepID=A0ABW2L3Y2_9BACT
MTLRILRAGALLLTALCFQIAAAVEPLYKTETWPDAPTLVWAKPGTTGDLSDAKNWQTEDGKPAKSAPDRDTDVILPESKKFYEVRGSRNTQVRHALVKSGARLGGGHRNELEVWGNLKVEPGGRVLYISIRGNKHTYIDIIDAEFPTKENGKTMAHPSTRVAPEKQCAAQISHKFQVAKVGTASVEVLGNLGISDEIMLQRGRMIVSGDLRYSGITNKGALEIYDGGILEIQSGGRVAPFDPENRKAVYNINIYRNGTIQAGSPERPLTSDAYLLLGYGNNDQPGRTGLYSALGSMIRVYSADPQKARLVVTASSAMPEFYNGKGQLLTDPDKKASGKNGIALQLAGDVQFDNTVFDYVSEGGIGLADPKVADTWKNVSFGSHNAGPKTKLISTMEADPNSYYHARGDMKSEFALTEKAIASMGEYLEDADPFLLQTLPENTEIKSVGRGKETIKTPIAKVFTEPVSVTVKCKVPGAKIRYSTNGSEPDKNSPEYLGPIKIDKTTRLMVKAYKLGVGFSPTFSTTYVIKP